MVKINSGCQIYRYFKSGKKVLYLDRVEVIKVFETVENSKIICVSLKDSSQCKAVHIDNLTVLK